MVENRIEFLEFLSDLEPYLVEFDFEGRIKEKNYPPGCEIRGRNRRLIICIIYDEYTFSVNDRKKYPGQLIGDTLFRSKRKRRGIMV